MGWAFSLLLHLLSILPSPTPLFPRSPLPLTRVLSLDVADEGPCRSFSILITF